MKQKNEYDYMEEYRQELKNLLEDNEENDPALYWAGKMSHLVWSVLNDPLIRMHPIKPKLLDLVRQEYDKEIFGRMKK